MRVLKSFFLAVILVAASVNLFARSTSRYPSVEPLFIPELELGYIPSKNLSANEVFKLSLLFSECPLRSVSGRRALQKFERIKNEVSSQEYMSMSEEERGKAVLALLYRDILVEYREDQSKVHVVFETGYYNCVSSALIYMAAAKAAGLEVRGQKTPAHAFCTVVITDKASGWKRRIDVETTNPYGFNPGSTGVVDYGENMKLYYVVPESDYSDRQEVSDKVFTGLIANNLCVDYLDNNDYFSAIPSMGAFYNLIKNEKSTVQQQIRDDFFGLPCSFMHDKTADISSCTASEYAEATIWFASFIERWGKTEMIQSNMDSAFNNLIFLCYQERAYDLAEAVAEQLKPYVSAKQFSDSQAIIMELFIATKLDGVAPRKKTEIINGMLDSGNVTASQKQRLLLELENAWLSILNERINDYDFRGGYEDSLLAEKQVPTSDTFKQTTQIFYQNCIVEIHNNFVMKANAGSYKEAKAILEQGLVDFPDDKTLLSDLALLKSAGIK